MEEELVKWIKMEDRAGEAHGIARLCGIAEEILAVSGQHLPFWTVLLSGGCVALLRITHPHAQGRLVSAQVQMTDAQVQERKWNLVPSFHKWSIIVFHPHN
jgi:hypothetical protein